MATWAWAHRLPLALLLLAAVACQRAAGAGRGLQQTGLVTLPATPVYFNGWACEKGGANPPGYVWCKGAYLAGAPGSILRAFPYSTPAQRADNCTADPYCLAWDTGFYLRYAVKPTWAWSNATGAGGTYIKEGVIPGSLHAMQVPGYKFVYMKDSAGFSIPGGNMLATPYGNALACSADPNCAGFSAYKAQLKSRVRTQECWMDIAPYWNQNDGLYIKDGVTLQNDDPAPDIPGYSKFPNLVDNTYNYQRINNGSTLDFLAAACASDTTCKAFDTNGWFKSDLKASTDWVAFGSAICNPNYAMYVKSAPLSTPLPVASPPPVVTTPPVVTASPSPSPSPSTASSSTVTQKIGIWIPFYNTQQDYDGLIQQVEGSDCLKGSFKAAVLIGPNSGPPAPGDADYTARYSKVANTKEWTALGYLHTNYGKRPLTEVLAQIDTWLARGQAGYGDLIQGVWINQVPPAANTADLQQYFGAVVDRVRFYGGLVAFNPGMDMTDCKLASMADFVNSFENTYAMWKSSGSKCTCATQTRCIASIHGYTGAGLVDDLSAVMADAVSRGFQGTFVTDGILPNHYSALPTFWKTEIQAVCKTVIP